MEDSMVQGNKGCGQEMKKCTQVEMGEKGCEE